MPGDAPRRTSATSMKVVQLSIDGALEITPNVFRDERGAFKETFAATRYRAAGIPESFVQDNISISERGVLRGLHGDRRMAKLVQVLAGAAFDVIVDIRPGSPTFRKWFGTMLEADRHNQLYIPQGCLHGFLATESGTVLSYKQSAEYDPGQEIGIAWNDPDIGIAWPLSESPILSPKDAANPTLRERGLL
jgi:dTDP-4-dehydrorhamnose 3,5-epimerase